MTHNLSKKDKYPQFYKYVASATINIYSTVNIKEGDKVRIGDNVYKLATNSEYKGKASLTELRGKSIFYYEFKIEKK